MSVYFGYPTVNRQSAVVSQAVRDRGLSLLRSKPCEIAIATRNLIPDPHHSFYVTNITAFMQAAATGETPYIGSTGYPVTSYVHPLPWALPSLVYDFEDMSRIDRSSLQAHSTELPGRDRRRPSYVMSRPSRQLLRSLVELGANQTTSHSSGTTVNIDAMKCILVLLRLLSAFIHCQVPFATTLDATDLPASSYLPSRKKRKLAQMTLASMMSTIETLESEPEDRGMGGKKTTGEDDEEEDEASPTFEAFMANPPAHSSDRWGPVASVPAGDGLFFPYCRELAIAEAVTTMSLVSDYFFTALASTDEEMADSMEQIKSAWGVAHNTNLGKEITHLSKVILVALKARSVVYPIYTNGSYEGSVLIGGSFTVCIKGVVHRPVPHEELMQSITENAQHTRAISRLSEILRMDFATVDNLQSIRALSYHAQGRELTEEQRTQVKQTAKHLAWQNSYWTCNPQNTLRFLRLLQSNDRIPDTVPMNPEYIFETERIGLVMCAFGYTAPSFLVPSARRTMTTVADVPHNFVVRPVSINAAIADMQNVIERGFVTVHILNPSKAHNDFKLTSDTKVSVWNAIRVLSAPAAPSNVPHAAGSVGRDRGARRNASAFDGVF